MINTDKILKYVPEQIINTINQLTNQGKITELQNWLTQCKQEIELRQEQKIEMNWLHYEKYYLEMILA